MKKNKCTQMGGPYAVLRRIAWLPLVLFSFKMFAQCTTCVGTQANVSVDQSCMATITYNAVVQGADSLTCPPYMIIVETPGGVPIVSGTNFVQLPAENWIGEFVNLRAVHLATNITCTRLAMISDNHAPMLTCPADTISCTASIDVADIEPITVTDNCNDLESLEFSDSQVNLDCAANPFIATIERQWIATDTSGNMDTCVQLIHIEKPDTSVVQFPPNDPVSCESPNLDPEITGFPTIDGNPIDTNSFCKMIAHFTDDTVSMTTNCGIRILRHWEVHDECTGDIKEHTQIIKVEDFEAPSILCQSSIIRQTDPDVCVATISLPPPMSVADNCGSLEISVIHPTNNIEQPLNQDIILPPGDYMVPYIVRDECLNADTCEMAVTVIDNQTPTAVCDEFTSVSLTTTGKAVVSASNFDDGSNDNCGPVHFLASRDGAPFTPTVVFDCADVGGPNIVVTVRVSEVLNGNSFSDCMVEVEVEDKLMPIFLSCPLDMTIDCDDDTSNLDDFGTPQAFDNCGFTVVETDTSDIQICGTGTITRIFTVTDDSGNSSTCQQVLTIENQTPFDGNTIVWPLDTTFKNVCLSVGAFDPEDLAPGYGFPSYPSDGCAMIAESYTNQIFDIDFPSCYKIVRNWTLIDWCQHNTNDPNSPGIWHYQQLIKIVDTVAAEIDVCASDMIVGINNDCTGAYVDLDEVTVDAGCNGEITITNNSPYADDDGADASGFYPMGTHSIDFYIEDGCGNSTSCSIEITVEDQKLPTPYCNTGIIGELQEMNGQAMATIPVSTLDGGSYDNCTDSGDLIFGIQLDAEPVNGVPTATELVFDCLGEGVHIVKVWVTDEAGNSDYCVTNITIQDNMDVCPSNDDDLMASISGDIRTEMGEDIEEVKVEVNGTNAFPDTTGLSGSFAIPNLPIGFNYTVIPEKDMNHENGVTTWDMVLLTKHVLGVKKLDTPYKIIAADINKSGTVTTMDVVELRKLILNINDNFPSNKSWRFVEKSHIFQDPTNPFFPYIPETLNVNNFTADELEANFTGVKIGDLNGSAQPNSLFSADDRSYLEDLVLSIDNQVIMKGEEFSIDLNSRDLQTLFGYQFTLNFDKEAIEFLAFNENEDSKLTEENFGWTHLNDGSITMSWFDLETIKLNPKDLLFSLKFKSKTNAQLSDLISLNSRYTLAEAYDSNEELMNVKLEFQNEQFTYTESTFELYQNQPNPFRNSTLISFHLPERVEGTLTIFDLSGKVLKTFKQLFNEGYNELKIGKEELNTTGVIYYQLETPSHTATRKMILIQ
ncbi:MAG: T9SS type A sorting domain-containing protein [Bacteroidetes bacterium]|nr:T9SS type A sorting domain-containing protein [Bacteroidota bacterium]